MGRDKKSKADMEIPPLKIETIFVPINQHTIRFFELGIEIAKLMPDYIGDSSRKDEFICRISIAWVAAVMNPVISESDAKH